MHVKEQRVAFFGLFAFLDEVVGHNGFRFEFFGQSPVAGITRLLMRERFYKLLFLEVLNRTAPAIPHLFACGIDSGNGNLSIILIYSIPTIKRAGEIVCNLLSLALGNGTAACVGECNRRYKQDC